MITSATRAAVSVFACAVVQIVSALVIVPPWQGPDEPQHLATVRMVRTFGPGFPEGVGDAEIERDIMRSMMRFAWWEHYGLPTPDQVPASFADGPAKVIGGYFGVPNGPRFYYRLVALLFDVFGINGALPQLYTMRAIAALLSMGIVVTVWMVSRVVFGDVPAIVITAGLCLHPQFVVGSITGGPDALVNFSSAIAWAAALMLVTFAQSARYLVVLWVAALVASLTRRLGAPLLIVFAGVTLWSLVRELGIGRRGFARVAVPVATVVVLAAASYPVIGVEAERAVRWASFNPRQSFEVTHARLGELPRFLANLYATFWLVLGWMRHFANPVWYAATAIFTVASLSGYLAGRVSTTRTGALVVSTALVVVQLVAIVAYHFGILQAGAMGRYLMPVLPAIMCLLWFGWRSCFSERHADLAAASFIAICAMLNVTAWTLVILPVYA